VDKESEGMEVLLWGLGLGMSKEVLLRFETMRKRLSGCGIAVSKGARYNRGFKAYRNCYFRCGIA
jgi:hypothetical protein